MWYNTYHFFFFCKHGKLFYCCKPTSMCALVHSYYRRYGRKTEFLITFQIPGRGQSTTQQNTAQHNSTGQDSTERALLVLYNQGTSPIQQCSSTGSKSIFQGWLTCRCRPHLLPGFFTPTDSTRRKNTETNKGPISNFKAFTLYYIRGNMFSYPPLLYHYSTRTLITYNVVPDSC